jgi:hypothetical protein
MALDISSVETEIRSIAGQMDLTWDEMATYYKAKMAEAGINGGVTSYTINGRTVQKDVRWWREAYTFAQQQAAVDDVGGIVGSTISFRSTTPRIV